MQDPRIETPPRDSRADREGGSPQEQAGQMAEQVQDRVDQGREQAAGGLHQAADAIRDRADGNMTGAAASRVASGMERTADYLKDNDTDAIRSDVETYVRDHPVQSLGAAIAAGFVIGRILR